MVTKHTISASRVHLNRILHFSREKGSHGFWLDRDKTGGLIGTGFGTHNALYIVGQ